MPAFGADADALVQALAEADGELPTEADPPAAVGRRPDARHAARLAARRVPGVCLRVVPRLERQAVRLARPGRDRPRPDAHGRPHPPRLVRPLSRKPAAVPPRHADARRLPARQAGDARRGPRRRPREAEGRAVGVPRAGQGRPEPEARRRRCRSRRPRRAKPALVAQIPIRLAGRQGGREHLRPDGRQRPARLRPRRGQAARALRRRADPAERAGPHPPVPRDRNAGRTRSPHRRAPKPTSRDASSATTAFADGVRLRWRFQFEKETVEVEENAPVRRAHGSSGNSSASFGIAGASPLSCKTRPARRRRRPPTWEYAAGDVRRRPGGLARTARLPGGRLPAAEDRLRRGPRHARRPSRCGRRTGRCSSRR